MDEIHLEVIVKRVIRLKRSSSRSIRSPVAVRIERRALGLDRNVPHAFSGEAAACPKHCKDTYITTNHTILVTAARSPPDHRSNPGHRPIQSHCDSTLGIVGRQKLDTLYTLPQDLAFLIGCEIGGCGDNEGGRMQPNDPRSSY
jgi:hypothetical protein